MPNQMQRETKQLHQNQELDKSRSNETKSLPNHHMCQEGRGLIHEIVCTPQSGQDILEENPAAAHFVYHCYAKLKIMPQNDVLPHFFPPSLTWNCPVLVHAFTSPILDGLAPSHAAHRQPTTAMFLATSAVHYSTCPRAPGELSTGVPSRTAPPAPCTPAVRGASCGAACQPP